MKFTLSLSRQNLYRMMRSQWKVCRKRKVLDVIAQQRLEDLNLEIVDGNDFVAPPERPRFDFSSIVGLAPKLVPKDEHHPLYKEQQCYIYRDNTLLLEGLPQALMLTNTVQVSLDCLPPRVQNLANTVQLPDQDELLKRSIRTSCMYDAEQKKLAVKKDPQRPAWTFPRDFGISESRKNRMLCSRLIHLCALACPEVSADRAVLHDVLLSVPLFWEDDPVQFQLRSDIFLSSNSPLPVLIDPSDVDGHPLTELTISHPLISLEEEHFYELENVFPLKEDSEFSHVHTIVVHYNDSEVKNIFDSPVMESQVLSRSMLKAFTAAVAQARYNHGPAIKDLPKPVVVQCVQTDGRQFHFSVLQLNSTDVNSNRRNVYWSLPTIPLYEKCSYIKGVPVLEDYNPQVFKHLLDFFVNRA